LNTTEYRPDDVPATTCPSIASSGSTASITGLAALSAAVLAACGGASGGSSDAPAPAPAPTPAPLSRAQASRVLGQAALGGTATDIENVRTLGLQGWIDQQFALPRSQGHVDWMRANGYEAPPPNLTNIDRSGVTRSVWRKLIASPDVLRQRVTLALSEIFVISLIPVVLPYRGFASGAFLDGLEANAFGNYRDLLVFVSKSPAMGAYLSFLNNEKGNPATGSQPDENYAREVMQLFSIGLLKLNLDGTPQLVDGAPQPTYAQADVTQLARVFTGWQLTAGRVNGPADPVINPMTANAAKHETGSSTFLGVTVPVGNDGESSLQLAISTFMSQPSVGPFIARQLIQRLVTSNPSAAYVQRVATAFNGDAIRAKGDMKATITAILTDPEATSDSTLTAADHGKLREPMVRFVQWARTFGLNSADNTWDIGDLSSAVNGLAQSPLRSPSVFNFFRPGYVPSASSLGEKGITAPEFQITNETTVAGYVNFMQKVIAKGIAGMTPNYAMLQPIATDANALVAELNVLLAAGQISIVTLATMAAAIASIDAGTAAGQANRINAALTLTMATPEYLIQK
jgi:uncharacterized protein (DUF1800 family)